MASVGPLEAWWSKKARMSLRRRRRVQPNSVGTGPIPAPLDEATVTVPPQVVIGVDDPHEWPSPCPRYCAATRLTRLPRGASDDDLPAALAPPSASRVMHISAGERARCDMGAQLRHLGIDPSSVSHKACRIAGRANTGRESRSRKLLSHERCAGAKRHRRACNSDSITSEDLRTSMSA
jgi:hypothetical protein